MQTEPANRASTTTDGDPAPFAAAPSGRPRDDTLHHMVTSLLFAAMTIVLLGVAYPLLMTAVAAVAFPHQANGSMVYVRSRAIGSDIIGQRWTDPKYFAGRPSAAGANGYDPTATGGTNLGPATKKLIDATRDAIRTQRRANPDATVPLPMDLVTSSASGIDPDISPQAAYFQAPRIAKLRHFAIGYVDALIATNIQGRELGFLGEPHVNVLRLNMALDGVR